MTGVTVEGHEIGGHAEHRQDQEEGVMGHFDGLDGKIGYELTAEPNGHGLGDEGGDAEEGPGARGDELQESRWGGVTVLGHLMSRDEDVEYAGGQRAKHGQEQSSQGEVRDVVDIVNEPHHEAI